MGKVNKRIEQKVPFTSVDEADTRVNLSHECDGLGRSFNTMKQVLLPIILKELLEKNKLSARTLAKQTSLPISTLSTYLSGKKASYAPEHLRVLADFFGVSIDYLLFRRGNEPTNLDLLKTEALFSGWVKIKVERAIPTKPDEDDEK